MITLSVTELLIGLLIMAGIGVLISLMVLIIKTIPGVAHLQTILKNTSELTSDAVAGVADAKAVVANVKTSVDNICGAVNQGKLSSIINIVKAVANMSNAAKNKETKQ
ncbi:MAG TPA: hypothetical protein PL035_03545 [Bacillota bacterium]|nr:hypothetical protein [Bacillota bacterium]HQC36135.1 hypothetical protein [Bacillota bacterium]